MNSSPAGFSASVEQGTTVPLDVQIEMVHSIKGLERAEIMRPGYAIEYDFSDPTQLFASLEAQADALGPAEGEAMAPIVTRSIGRFW